MITDPKDILLGLQEPIPFMWRVMTGNKCAAYIDARDCQDKLDSVLGLGGWSSRHFEIAGNIYCEVSVLAGDTWVKRSSAGETSRDLLVEDYKIQIMKEANESNDEALKLIRKDKNKLKMEIANASKNDDSDAFKRACVALGIGRFLYSFGFYYLKKADYNNYSDEVNGKTFNVSTKDPTANSQLSDWINSNMPLPLFYANWINNIADPNKLVEFAKSQTHYIKNTGFRQAIHTRRLILDPQYKADFDAKQASKQTENK